MAPSPKPPQHPSALDLTEEMSTFHSRTSYPCWTLTTSTLMVSLVARQPEELLQKLCIGIQERTFNYSTHLTQQ